MRAHLRLRAAALRSARGQVVQMSSAAGLSWLVAHDLIGLAVLVVAPQDPRVQLRRAVEPALAEIGGVLEAVASALDAKEPAAAARALTLANATAGLDAWFQQQLNQARETALIAPAQW